ncbi:MAG: cbb3-type cytochrome c oxidase subunit I, partial [Candidatus Saccharimonadales bacterium]
MTMLIAIPTGVKIFNWLFTMYQGRIRLTSPMLWFLGFVFLFTMGGMTGVLMAIPPIDFQVHNSLFLVAHFHTMIISGVVFGLFAGLTYWFPKIFGFKLNERLGKYAAWCWIIGFILAFGPLYILGLMGATRRLDHYSASLGWQPLFIVAGIGAAIICLGVAIQILQLVYSIYKRKDNLDIDGDPWDARTLEWSTGSPAPEYNFAILPVVTGRDAFWMAKQAGDKRSTVYEDIRVPANTPVAFLIGAWSLALGFGFVWHIWWLVILAALGALVTVMSRLLSESDHERVITAAEVAATEAKLRHRLAPERTA